MSDPDGNYRQHPQQPPWDARRPAGQYPTGAQYPTGGQYPTGARYPAGGQPGVGYPTGSQYPASGWYGQYPEGNQYPGAPPSAPDRPGQEWDPAGT